MVEVVEDVDEEPYELYQALYTYQTTEEDDLAFEAGDILKVTDAGVDVGCGRA